MLNHEIEIDDLHIIIDFLKFTLKPYSTFLKHGFWVFHQDIVLVKKILNMSCNRSRDEISRIVKLFLDQIYISINKLFHFLQFKNSWILEDYLNNIEKNEDPWLLHAPITVLTLLLKNNTNLPLNISHIIESIHDTSSNSESFLLQKIFRKDLWFPGYMFYPSDLDFLKKNKKTILRELISIYHQLGKISDKGESWSTFTKKISKQVKSDIANIGTRLLNRDVYIIYDLTDIENIDITKTIIYNNRSKDIARLSLFTPRSLPLYGESGLEKRWKESQYYQKYLRHRSNFIKNSNLLKVLLALRIIEKKISPELIYYVDIENPARIVVMWPIERDILIDKCLNMNISNEPTRVMSDLYNVSKCILMSLI